MSDISFLPEAFVARMRQLLGDEADDFFNALKEPASTSLRINPEKFVSTEESIFAELISGSVPWCDQGLYLRRRPIFTLDPLFHAGTYYIQEASSMFLQHILKQICEDRPIKVLDLCAAPGGKSTLLGANLPTDSLVVANEVIKSRASILKENIIKWGVDSFVVTSCDPSRFAQLKNRFEIILVDAPCSGEGMFRKDPKVINEWNKSNLRLCEERQRQIIDNCWDALAPGGFIIYSTCTYNPNENERITEWIADKLHASPVEIKHNWPEITPGYSSLPTYRFYPHRVKGEGFYISILQKEGSLTSDYRARVKTQSIRRKNTQEIKLPVEAAEYINNYSSHKTYLSGSIMGIIPKNHVEFIRELESTTGVLYKGCEIGENIHGKFKPTHSLALYSKLCRKNVEQHQLSLEDARNYLRKNEITFSAPKGRWILVTYKDMPLGWIKEAGSRLNNYYPKEWRIKQL